MQLAKAKKKTRDKRKAQAAAETTNYATPEGIIRFVREILGADPAPYQEDVLKNFVEKRRAAVRSLHGVGKTTLSAWIVLWAVACFPEDVKVVTTASAHRQLMHFTWPEIRKWALKANWDKMGITMRDGKELLETRIKLSNSREAFAVASDNPSLIEGAHAKHLVYVFDEAKAIPTPTWDAAEGAFSTGDCWALAISTPGDTSGRFYEIHKRRPGTDDWWTRHIQLKEGIAAGRINPEWVDNRRKQWGEQSAVFQNRVLGEFAEDAADVVIPLSWAEAAQERWYAAGGKGAGTESHGVDPAYKGEDLTTHAKKVGAVIEKINHYAKEDTMQTSGRVAASVSKDVPIGIDTIGVGAGVYDRLRELKFKVYPVNVSERAVDRRNKPLTDGTGEVEFENLRAFIWWQLREALDPANPYALAIPPDDEDRLIGDLTAPRYSYSSRGKIKVESKDDLRERIGRSTDFADAVGLAVHAEFLSKTKSKFPSEINVMTF